MLDHLKNVFPQIDHSLVAEIAAKLTPENANDPSFARQQQCHRLHEELRAIFATTHKVTDRDALAGVMNAALATATEWETEALAVRRIGFDPAWEDQFKPAWDKYCKGVTEIVTGLQSFCDGLAKSKKEDEERRKDALVNKVVAFMACVIRPSNAPPVVTTPGREAASRKRGAPAKHDPEKDRRLVQDWESSGLTKPQYERERQLSDGEIRRARDRLRHPR